MAGKPIQHGNSWRVKWTHPDNKGTDVREIATLPSEPLGWEFKRWVEQEARKGNYVYQGDSQVLDGSWLTGLQPAVNLRQTYLEFVTELVSGKEGAIEQRVADEYLAIVRKHFADWCTLHPSQITADMIQRKGKEFDSKTSKNRFENVSANSAKKYMNYAKGYLAHAKRMGIITFNPFDTHSDGSPRKGSSLIGDKAASGARQSNVNSVFLASDYVDLLIEAAPTDEIALMMRTDVLTGLRSSELFGLRKCDLFFRHDDGDYGKSTLRVENAILGRGAEARDSNPKKHSKRTLPLPPQLARDLENLVADREWEDYIFQPKIVRGRKIVNGKMKRHWMYGTFQTNYWPAIRQGAWDLGMPRNIEPTGLHVFRHTFASRLFAKGWTCFQVSEPMGHSDVTVTYKTYGHLEKDSSNEMCRSAQAEFDRDPAYLRRLMTDAA
jgi:integrase